MSAELQAHQLLIQHQTCLITLKTNNTDQVVYNLNVLNTPSLCEVHHD